MGNQRTFIFFIIYAKMVLTECMNTFAPVIINYMD